MYNESRAQMSFIEFDNKKEFESNLRVASPDEDKDQGDGPIEANVTDVANALANQHPFEELSFMRVLDLEGNCHYGMKDYTIRRGADYRVYESEPLKFYVKCTEYMSGCDWLIRVSMVRRKYCWVITRYNGSHTCTRVTISQDHSKLDSNTIAEAINPLVKADPSIKVKSIIAEVQLKFNYTISYCKVWLAKQKLVEKNIRRLGSIARCFAHMV
ncbi:hypothetical protein Ahy_A03g012753 [Arachis hypogaea]|uniref:Uncharacterized protein n=1 Tax=Arachis hypogaea TaxID=3818 RepID=A0A445DUA5_ARAHY|nr:hypothetical protein Ahy_A03g012753 [Arachis hypogaea]